MEAPSLDRRLVAILAADVEGYSRLMALDEEATLATLSAHRAAVDELIVSFRGRIANTAGDSVLAEFASVVDAVRCALGCRRRSPGSMRGLPSIGGCRSASASMSATSSPRTATSSVTA